MVHTAWMYWTGVHTKLRKKYHFVWIPKYRKRVLKGTVKDGVERLFHECAEVNDWCIVELNVQQDHVHILVQWRPNISLSKVVQIFKGGSSKVIREKFPELKEFVWGDSFWADGFFAERAGKVNESYD